MSRLPSRLIDDKRYLPDLLPFVEAARCGSFSGAARALLLTPSAVSKSISRLEQTFEVRLFVRTTRQLRLTAEGQGFLERVEKSLSMLGDAVATLSEARAEPSGQVRIACIAAFGRHFVLPLLPGLLQRFPKLDIELNFDDGTPDPIIERSELAIRSAAMLSPNSVARPIALLPLVLVASPAYLKAQGVPRHPKELARHACVSIRLPSGQPARWVFADAQGRSQHLPQGRLVLSEQPADALVDCALAGLGVTAIAACMVVNELRSGKLKLLLPQYHLKSHSEFFMQHAERAHLAHRVRITADFLLAGLNADPRLNCVPADLVRFAA